MNGEQRGRIQLREYARYRVGTATRWVAIASSVLAAAFAVLLTYHSAPANSGSTDTPAVAPPGNNSRNAGQNAVVPLQSPVQVPNTWLGGGYSHGSSGGS